MASLLKWISNRQVFIGCEARPAERRSDGLRSLDKSPQLR